jgi:hypothetical protein
MRRAILVLLLLLSMGFVSSGSMKYIGHAAASSP